MATTGLGQRKSLSPLLNTYTKVGDKYFTLAPDQRGKAWKLRFEQLLVKAGLQKDKNWKRSYIDSKAFSDEKEAAVGMWDYLTLGLTFDSPIQVILRFGACSTPKPVDPIQQRSDPTVLDFIEEYSEVNQQVHASLLFAVQLFS